MKALILPLLLVLGGCTLTGPDVTGELSSLEEARRHWRAQNISDYDMNLVRGCFCVGAGELTVSVRSDSVAVVLDRNGHWWADNSWWQYVPSVEDLFDLIEDATLDADDVQVTYHEKYGYPVELSIDWLKDAVDDEISYTIQSLDAAPDTDVVALKIGPEVEIGGGVRLQFTEVVEDSRCPHNADCIWAGRAVVGITAHFQDALESFQLVHGAELEGDADDATAWGYTFQLVAVSPYPAEAGVPIRSEDYRAVLVITEND